MIGQRQYRILLYLVVAAMLASCSRKDTKFPPRGYIDAKVKEPTLVELASLPKNDPIHAAFNRSNLCIYAMDSRCRDLIRMKPDGSKRELVIDAKNKDGETHLGVRGPMLHRRGLLEVYGFKSPVYLAFVDQVPDFKGDPPLLKNYFTDECRPTGGPDIILRNPLNDLDTQKPTGWSLVQVFPSGRLEPRHYHRFLRSQVFTNGRVERPFNNNWKYMGIVGQHYAVLSDKNQLIYFDLEKNRRIKVLDTASFLFWRRDLDQPERLPVTVTAAVEIGFVKYRSVKWTMKHPGDFVLTDGRMRHAGLDPKPEPGKPKRHRIIGPQKP